MVPRRTAVATAALALALPVGGVALAHAVDAAAERSNGVGAAPATPPAQATALAARRIECAVLDPALDPTTTVAPAGFQDPSYFLSYSPNGVPTTRVTFTVRAQFPESPLREQTQTFNIRDDRETGITTPFGVPEWGLDRTSGPYVLIVRNAQGQTARCPFTVVAEE